jgi:hypothetical protein
MSIEVPGDAWISREDADTYFKTRLKSAAWRDSVEEDKDASLVTAKAQLEAVFTGMPADPTDAMEKANCEQALFLLQQGGDNDMRGALQAQGVTAAGVVKEQYDAAAAGKVAICPMARQLLKDYFKQGVGGLFQADLTRDEER